MEGKKTTGRRDWVQKSMRVLFDAAREAALAQPLDLDEHSSRDLGSDSLLHLQNVSGPIIGKLAARAVELDKELGGPRSEAVDDLVLAALAFSTLDCGDALLWPEDSVVRAAVRLIESRAARGGLPHAERTPEERWTTRKDRPGVIVELVDVPGLIDAHVEMLLGILTRLFGSGCTTGLGYVETHIGHGASGERMTATGRHALASARALATEASVRLDELYVTCPVDDDDTTPRGKLFALLDKANRTMTLVSAALDSVERHPLGSLVVFAAMDALRELRERADADEISAAVMAEVSGNRK